MVINEIYKLLSEAKYIILHVSRSGNFIDVRLAALRSIVDTVQGTASYVGRLVWCSTSPPGLLF